MNRFGKWFYPMLVGYAAIVLLAIYGVATIEASTKSIEFVQPFNSGITIITSSLGGTI